MSTSNPRPTPCPASPLHGGPHRHLGALALVALCLVGLFASTAEAQRRPSRLQPGGRQIRPTPAQRNTSAPASPSRAPSTSTGEDGAASTHTPSKSCAEVRKNARFNVFFEDVEIQKLVQTVADATCRTFIVPDGLRGKISIIGPENGQTQVTGDEFYSAFLAALAANNLSVYRHGEFLKIVDARKAKQSPIPTYTDPDAPYTWNEQMITKLLRLKHSSPGQLVNVLKQLVTEHGDVIAHEPDTLIINDLGHNIHRLERIIDRLDSASSADELTVIQVQFANASEVATTLKTLFATSGSAATPQTPAQARVSRARRRRGQPTPQAPATDPEGAVSITEVLADERTNKLIVVASPSAVARIHEVLEELDVPIAGEGRINVHYLDNANAEDLAATLQTLAQDAPGAGTTTPRRTAVPRGGNTPQTASAPTSAELFSGEVKISADTATNSLVIIASQSDYRNLLRVIKKLDIPRRQVFVEAVIMEVNVDRSSEFGMSLHTGLSLDTPQGKAPGIVGTHYQGSGIPPSFSLESLLGFGGFLAGLQGPVIPELARLGLNIPSFGVVLHAMQASSDVNVISTPHLLTSDNEEAEIIVGQNVPFQSGFSPTNLGSSLGGVAGAAGGLGGVGGQLATQSIFGGGLGSLFAPISRENVELNLTIKPQVNESDYIRLEISKQIEEIASQDPVLGPTTSKRSAKTVVVAKNQETIVIGGIMQERRIDSVTKIPVLGDLPLLGHLFRETTQRKVKTNLLLFLTPYIIDSPADFRAIYERKMKERQQFIERFYGDSPEYRQQVDFRRKVGPLTHMGVVVEREQSRLENGGPGLPGERLIAPEPEGSGTGGRRRDRRGSPDGETNSDDPQASPDPETGAVEPRASLTAGPAEQEALAEPAGDAGRQSSGGPGAAGGSDEPEGSGPPASERS